jgi:septum formation protein
MPKAVQKPPKTPHRRLVLASTSPRRRVLLTDHGYDFMIVPADVEEISPSHLTPKETVLWNARIKAHAVAPLHPSEIIIGVDTLVAFEGQIFGKPHSMDEAFRMAKTLNGKTHEVFSGVCLTRYNTREERTLVEVTRVHFRKLTDTQLRTYLARISPLDKAGAYAAQDDQGELIDRVEGSFTNVTGLPMESLECVLREFRQH